MTDDLDVIRKIEKIIGRQLEIVDWDEYDFINERYVLSNKGRVMG